jgi:hypothetical protein
MFFINTFDTSFIFFIVFLFSFIACTLRLHFNFGGDKLSFIDRLLVTDPIIISFLFLFCSLIFIYIFSALCYVFSLDISVLHSGDELISWLADKDNTNVNIGENATVNVTTNGGQVTIPVNHLNKTAAAISMGAGVSAGIQAAKYVGGSPVTKLAAAGLAVGAVQLGTVGMSKVLGSTDTKDSSSKLVANFDVVGSSDGGGGGSSVLNDYPLNLLVEVNGLLICALAFLYIILNIYISKYIISAKPDFVKYIPASLQNHKIGKFLGFLLNKYLNLWSKNSNYFLGFCYFMLLFCIAMCKFFLFVILSG